MDASKKISVNLSSRKKVSVSNAFYKWAFEAGRAIVVLIELVALGALGYRFLVDGDIVDLHEDIDRQEVLITNRRTQEETYRGIQERLENIQLITTETEGKIQVMNHITTAIQEGVFTETDLSISQNSIQLSGDSISIFSLENFINNLQELEQISAISVDEINTSATGIKFKIRIVLISTEQPA